MWHVNFMVFCHIFGNTTSETLKLIEQAYENDALSCTRGSEWHKLFKESQEPVENEHRAGCPTSAGTDAHVAKVKKDLDFHRY